MTQFTLFLPYLLVIVICTATAQNQVQMADFEIFTDTEYIVSISHNLISTIMDKSVSSLVECADKCLAYALCETATYYIQTQTCSLYRERCGIGQLISVGTQTASVISLNYQNPPVTSCADPSDGNLVFFENQFIYSPNQLFAFGMVNYTMGVYYAYAYGSIGSAIWQPTGPIPNSGCFAAQYDGNLVLYSSSCGSGAVWSSGTQPGASWSPYCLNLLDTGHLVWLDKTNLPIWSH